MTIEKENKEIIKNLAQNEKEFILKEIEVNNNKIDKFDHLSIIVKGWAITLWSGLLFFALGQSDIQIKIPILTLSIVGLVLFWFIDANLKYFQRLFIARDILIADYLNNEMKNGGNENFKFYIYDPMGLLSSKLEKGEKKCDNYYYQKYRKTHLFWRSIFVRMVAALYCILIFITSLLIVIFLTFPFSNMISIVSIFLIIAFISFVLTIFSFWASDKQIL